MPTAKKYFQDKMILLLLSLNLFAALLVSVIIALRISSNPSESYIVQYRSVLGVGEFKSGSILDFIYIIVFALLVVAFNFVLSFRMYHIRRQLSMVLLGMSVLLLAVAFIVSNALLVLR